MAVADIEGKAGLATTLGEVGREAFAVRVLGEHTVAHVALAVHIGAAKLSGNHPVQVFAVDGIAAPHLSLLYLDVVVVAEDVALVDELSRTVETHGVQVVLHIVVIGSIGAECIRVDVVERVASQQVVHGLIMVAFVVAVEHTVVQRGVLGGLGGQRRSDVECQIVVVLGLHVVEGVGACGGSLFVGPVEAVPVHLPVGLRSRPVVVGPGPVGECCLVVALDNLILVYPHLIIAAGQVFPVVGLGILGIVVVQLGAFVHRVFAEDRCHELRVFVDVPVPRHDG